jgi:arginase
MVARLSTVRLVKVPYDSGRYDVRMGSGPLALARAGAAQHLRQQGHVVRERLVAPASSWCAEVKTAFELQRLIAAEAATARAAGEVPILLSGNCNATLGMLAGQQSAGGRLGLVWLDAHGDFNTPETDPGGFLDGQGLAMVVGRCWRTLTSAVPGFSPLPERRVVLIGAHSLDGDEETALRGSSIAWLPPARVRDPGSVPRALDALAAEADHVHIHIDLDVHDPSIAPANGYAVPGGLSAEEVHQVLRHVANRVRITSATLAAYDPACDLERRMESTALTVLALLARLARPTSGHHDNVDGG